MPPLITPLIPNISKRVAGKIFDRVASYRQPLISRAYAEVPSLSQGSTWKSALKDRVGSHTAGELSTPVTEIYNASVIDDIASRFHVTDAKKLYVLGDDGAWHFNEGLTGRSGGRSTESLLEMGGHNRNVLSDQTVQKMFHDNAKNLQYAIDDSWRLGTYRGYKDYDADLYAAIAPGETAEKMREISTNMRKLKENGIISSGNYNQFFKKMRTAEDDATHEIGNLNAAEVSDEVVEATKSKHFIRNISQHTGDMRDDALGGIISRFQVNKYTGNKPGIINATGVSPRSFDSATENTVAHLQGSRAVVHRDSLANSMDDLGFAWHDWNKHIQGTGQSWSRSIKFSGFLDAQAISRRSRFASRTTSPTLPESIDSRLLASQVGAQGMRGVGEGLRRNIDRLSQGEAFSLRAADDLADDIASTWAVSNPTNPLSNDIIYSGGESTLKKRKDLLWEQEKSLKSSPIEQDDIVSASRLKDAGKDKVSGEPRSLILKLNPKPDRRGNPRPAKTLASLQGEPIEESLKNAQPQYFGTKQFFKDTDHLEVGHGIGRRIEFANPLSGSGKGRPMYVWMNLKRRDNNLQMGNRKVFKFELSPYRKVAQSDGTRIWSPESVEGKVIMDVPVDNLAYAISSSSRYIKSIADDTSVIKVNELARLLKTGSGSDKLTYIDMTMSFRNFSQRGVDEATRSRMRDLFVAVERLVDKKGKNLILNLNSLSTDSQPKMMSLARMMGAKAVVLPKSVFNQVYTTPYEMLIATNTYGKHSLVTKNLIGGKHHLEILGKGSSVIPGSRTSEVVTRGAPGSAELRGQLEGANRYLEGLYAHVKKSRARILGERGTRETALIPYLDAFVKDGVLMKLTENNFKQVIEMGRNHLRTLSSSGVMKDIGKVATHSDKILYDKSLIILTRALPLALLAEGMKKGEIPILLPNEGKGVNA